MLMKTTRDPDSGVVDQDCRPLCPELVWHGVKLAVKNEQEFMGRSHAFWQELICETAQAIADEADDVEFDMWGVRGYER